MGGEGWIKDSFRDADLWSRRAQETVGTGGSSDSFPSVRCAFPPPGLNRVAVAGCTVRVRKARKLTAAGTVTDSHRVPGATLRPSPVPAAKIAIEIQSRKKKPVLGAEPTAERSAAGPPGRVGGRRRKERGRSPGAEPEDAPFPPLMGPRPGTDRYPFANDEGC